MTKVVVLGAGVIGLTAALELKRANPNIAITVVAAHLPGDLDSEYTSPFAGANWHSFAHQQDNRLQEIDEIGYRRFVDLAATEPKAGIWTITNRVMFTDEYPNVESVEFPWFSRIVNGFSELHGENLVGNAVKGFSFNGVVLATPIYLNYLLQKNLEMGVIVKRVPKVKSLALAKQLHSEGEADLVINCGGLLVRELEDLNDPNRNYTIRGQVVHVRNCAKTEIEVEGFKGLSDEMLYLMPRKEGGCIIGGCFQKSDNIHEDPELTKRILARAKRFVPELTDPSFQNNPTEIDIVRVNVGFRPFREGGARIEQDSTRPWLIHSYGAGGGGYQGSYGFARKVVQLVNDATRQHKL